MEAVHAKSQAVQMGRRWGVWRRMCFCPDLFFSSSGSSLFTVRYLQGVLWLSCKKM